MSPIIIPNFSRRNEFIQILAEREAKIGVEVGTDRGVYAKQLCEGIPGLKLYCVDPWVAYTEGNDVHDQNKMEQIYKEAYDRVVNRGGTLIRETSTDAVEGFEDNELDFVFIDGNHSYENVLEDITEWTKKVKPGGIVAGHDFVKDDINGYGVIEAVIKYTTDNHIAPWFVFEKKGLVPCFMFFKQ